MYWVPFRDFAWICDEAEAFHQELLDDDGSRALAIDIDPSEFVDWMLKLLRVNYHILPEVASHLGLWRASQLTDAVLGSAGPY